MGPVDVSITRGALHSSINFECVKFKKFYLTCQSKLY